MRGYDVKIRYAYESLVVEDDWRARNKNQRTSYSTTSATAMKPYLALATKAVLGITLQVDERTVIDILDRPRCG